MENDTDLNIGDASIYNDAILGLPVGADLLPHLVYSGPYWACIKYLVRLPRSERSQLICYCYPPRFTDDAIPAENYPVHQSHDTPAT